MEEKNRKTGIDIIGSVPWGTHLCQFYETKQDLIDILVPYFKAGLENNEYCMWVCWDPLRTEESRNALSKTIWNLDDYIKKGQIEIVDYSKQYTVQGDSGFDKMKQFWIEKEKLAFERGFEGLRLAGNTYWLESNEWEDFIKYEEEVDRIIRGHKMLAICPYSLDKCGVSEVIEVLSNHGSALIKREGTWELIESSKHKKLEEALKESEEKYKALAENMSELVYIADAETWAATYINKAIEKTYGYTQKEWFSDPYIWEKTIYPEKREKIISQVRDAQAEGRNIKLEYRIITKDGEIKWLEDRVSWQKDKNGKIVALHRISIDITERKKAEEAVDKVNKCFLSFGFNPDENIKKIVETAGLVLEGTCALYNKEEVDLLCAIEGWNVPKDLKREDTKVGHICYDVIKGHKDEPLVINDLDKTSYAKTDPNVIKYKLKTYIACAVKIGDEAVGSLCVVYQGDRRFIPDELKILSILAKALGIEEERKKEEKALKESESQLREQKLSLEQKNLALKEMIEHIERTKNKLKDDIAVNVNEILLPILKKLKIRGESRKYIDLLYHHLSKLTSSFGRKITQKSIKLTPREIEICNAVKGDLTSKELSKLLNISPQTIEKHRRNIRKKLGISNKKVNLVSFLQKI